MNPSASSDTEAPAEGSTEAADARALTLHLEVCRMQTELEVLERRIGQYEQAEATGVGPHDPFAERAEDLVQRMIDALYAIGRSEIAESSNAARAEADAVVESGRTRAREILVAARAELADALTERAEAVDATRALTRDVVDLTTADHAPPPPPPPVDVVPLPPAEAPAAAVVAPSGPTTDAPDAPDAPAHAEAPSGPIEVPPVESPDPALVVDDLPWAAPDAPFVPTPAPTLPPPAPTSAAAESRRTDDAFDAWLAVAPVRGEGDPVDAGGSTPVPGRPGWVRPLEGAVALLVVALLVVLALLVIG